MLQRAYTLHDVKARVYSPPFFTHNDDLAKRMIADLLEDKNTSVARHPADFKLYWIGHFDDLTGILQPLLSITHVADCVSLLPPQQPTMFDVPMKMKWDKFQEWMQNGEAK